MFTALWWVWVLPDKHGPAAGNGGGIDIQPFIIEGDRPLRQYRNGPAVIFPIGI